MTEPTIGFIGGGNMGGALIGGLVTQGVPGERIWVSDHNVDHLTALQSEHGIQVATSNLQVAQQADVVVVAVKPPIVQAVCEECAEVFQDREPLLVSVAAGVTCESMLRWSQASKALPIVRCMPNTPSLMGCGASGLYANEAVSDAQRALAQSLLESVGVVVWLPEEANLDAVTAVSGSGPAYFFLMLESMVAAGQALGLTESVASTLAIQTALGAAKMAQSSGVDPKELRRRVTSPGGTTAAAIEVFQTNGFEMLVAKALQAADERAKALGRGE